MKINISNTLIWSLISLNILNIIRQNPEVDKKQLFGDIEIEDERPNDLNILDSIEEL